MRTKFFLATFAGIIAGSTLIPSLGWAKVYEEQLLIGQGVGIPDPGFDVFLPGFDTSLGTLRAAQMEFNGALDPAEKWTLSYPIGGGVYIQPATFHPEVSVRPAATDVLPTFTADIVCVPGIPCYLQNSSDVMPAFDISTDIPLEDALPGGPGNLMDFYIVASIGRRGLDLPKDQIAEVDDLSTIHGTLSVRFVYSPIPEPSRAMDQPSRSSWFVHIGSPSNV